MFYLTKEMMKNCGEDGPIESKHRKEKWGRCIRILVQDFDERQQGAYQYNFD